MGYQAKAVMKDLPGRLDEAIDDMEQGRVQTIEEAWAEIDAIYSIPINGSGKCAGFARTHKLLANAVGLKWEFHENGVHMSKLQSTDN